MPIIGKTPGEGRGFVTFTFDKVKPGSKRTGFLSGDVHGLTCHPAKKTKPCIRSLKGPKHSCRGCDEHIPPAWCGYVPLRDSTGRPVCILIRDSVVDVAARIKPGARVVWGRDDDDFAPVWLQEWHQGAEWSRWYPDKKPADDMAPWLCTLWGMADLLPYLRACFNGECQPAVTHESSIPPPETPTTRGGWVRQVANQLTTTELGESVDTVLARRSVTETAPSKNGRKPH